MKKSILRQYFLNKRKNYTPHYVNQMSQKIANNFFSTLKLDKIKYIHSFLPIVSFNEVNTWYILRRLWTHFPHIQTAVPVSDFTINCFESFLLQEQTELETNQWGIPEPTHRILIAERDINLVLCPLLAFDKKGFRVGYGKGFYDRFFQKCQPGAIKVGLSFEEAVEHIEDINQYDIPLNYCVTPKKFYVF